MAKKAIGSKEDHERIYKIIDGAGGPDQYVDIEEEQDIFSQAEAMGVWKGQTEAMLNHRCKVHGWTREREIMYYLRIMLIEATKDDDGEIDRKEFDHVIGFAVAVRMPRKDAMRNCVKLVREGGWKTSKEGMLKKKDWLAEYDS